MVHNKKFTPSRFLIFGSYILVFAAVRAIFMKAISSLFSNLSDRDLTAVFFSMYGFPSHEKLCNLEY